MTHKHATLEDTVYYYFGANDTSGSGNDGASAAAHVRLAGAAAGAAPVLSPTPTLLSHASFPAGCYEVPVAATAANGFTATNSYAVFCTLAVDGQNPTGFIGSFMLDPIIANIKEVSDDSTAADNLELSLENGTAGYVASDLKYLDGTAQRATDLAEIAQYLIANSVTLSANVDLGSIIGQLLDNGTAWSYDRTTDSQEAIRDQVGSAIAGDVWDDVASGHTTPGTFGELMGSIPDKVWDEVIEAGAPANAQTARQIYRILIAAAAGVDGDDGSDWSVKAIDDSKVRIAGSLTSTGLRSVISTLDGS